MSDVIENLYREYKIPEKLIARKIQEFDDNPDIRDEFEYWINKGEYKSDNPVCIEGYTAQLLAQLNKNLEGEGAFSLLIELRKEPEKAIRKIKQGFQIM